MNDRRKARKLDSQKLAVVAETNGESKEDPQGAPQGPLLQITWPNYSISPEVVLNMRDNAPNIMFWFQEQINNQTNLIGQLRVVMLQFIELFKILELTKEQFKEAASKVDAALMVQQMDAQAKLLAQQPPAPLKEQQ